jgi:hypothetical protein
LPAGKQTLRHAGWQGGKQVIQLVGRKVGQSVGLLAGRLSWGNFSDAKHREDACHCICIFRFANSGDIRKQMRADIAATRGAFQEAMG